ncbi:hypothetical protein [Sphingomonas cavernae]|uniref:Uncharacterized protein n=1 Tax=Sphingomonas cavernae TaxID=2320861 RepID=A0A418WJW6_9SPHN|nr:hypothetical protein [Sphingomonas cavernae]RJF90336.1 hypothetical protein D3876_08750 [Sphingomonas cavernae]
MKLRHIWLLSLLPLAACVERPSVAPPPPVGAAQQVTVTLYRGLRVLPGTNNQIDWSRNSFGVSGQPPTLSLFNAMALPNIPCWISFDVDAIAPVGPGAIASLTIPHPPPGDANPGPWNVVFDDNPPGHWSIARATIGGANNTQSSNMAAAVFHAKVVGGSAQIHDGTAVGCH